MAPTTSSVLAAASAYTVSTSPQLASAAAPAAPPVWHVACKRCLRGFATSDQVYFLRENEQSFHLALRKHLLYDEQQQDSSDPDSLQRKKSWKVLSHAHVTPPMQFFKSHTRQPNKRGRIPYEIFCSSCQAKVAGECHVDEWPTTEYLLDSKSCECVVVAEQAAGSADNGQTKIRKWGLLFKKLQLLRLPVHTEIVASPLLLEIDERPHASQASGTSESASRYASKRQQSLAQSRAGVSEQQGVVFPTEESIRRSFTATCKLTPLRPYQVELALSALLENTIVYLPTGMPSNLRCVMCVFPFLQTYPVWF